MKERQKVEEWEEMEEINNLQNVNQTDQLEALGFKMKSKIIICQEGKANEFRKTKCRECENQSIKKKRKNRYVDAARKIEIEAIWGTWGHLYEYIFGNSGRRR